MIHNDEQLELVRQQLGHLEAAYQDLEQDVRPESEQWFQLMAEGYVKEISKLRKEIERYSSARGRSEDSSIEQRARPAKRRPA